MSAARTLGLSEDVAGDLKLAVSELASPAIEQRAASVSVVLDETSSGITLSVSPFRTGRPVPNLPGPREIVQTLFPDSAVRDDTIIVTITDNTA